MELQTLVSRNFAFESNIFLQNTCNVLTRPWLRTPYVSPQSGEIGNKTSLPAQMPFQRLKACLRRSRQIPSILCNPIGCKPPFGYSTVRMVTYPPSAIYFRLLPAMPRLCFCFCLCYICACDQLWRIHMSLEPSGAFVRFHDVSYDFMKLHGAGKAS